MHRGGGINPTKGRILLDVRPSAAYIGWRLAGEARGGHIPDARSLPAGWLDILSEAELLLYLQSMRLDRTDELLVYGYDTGEAEAFARRFAQLGLAAPAIYRCGYTEWAADPGLPVERLPRFHQLVHPDWVRQLIEGLPPETYPGRGFVILHVGFEAVKEYEEAHLPGAVYLDTTRLESPGSWNRRSPQEIAGVLGSLGIERETTVVLYGRDRAPEPGEAGAGRSNGLLAAFRAAAILTYAGLADLRVLDGGFGAWVGAGLPVEAGSAGARAASVFHALPAPGVFIDLRDLRRILADPTGRLVDVRSWAEYAGEVSGYDYIKPRGRIPGAVWGGDGFRSPVNTLRSDGEIAAGWDRAGVTREHRAAFYCGTGWRASEAWFYARLMGWDRAAIYDGGWLEWSGDPDNPIAAGGPGFSTTAPRIIC